MSTSAELGPYDHDRSGDQNVPEPRPVFTALSALNLAEHNYRKEPWALDLFEELVKARKRWAEVVERALAEEETDE